MVCSSSRKSHSSVDRSRVCSRSVRSRRGTIPHRREIRTACAGCIPGSNQKRSRTGACLRYADGVATENHDSFFQRIEPFFSPRELRKIDLAYMLAKYAHRAQTRNERDEQGAPVRYFEHVRRATLVGLDEAKIVRLDTTIASFLHDTREDTRLSADQIEDCFGSEMCCIVKVLSKVPKEGYLERFYVCTDWRPYFVKACDRLDNLRSLSQSSVEFRRKQVTETRDKYYRLFDRMVMLTPEEYRDGTRRLRDLIHSTTDAVPLTDEAISRAS